MKLLLVEDEEILSDALAQRLRKFGYAWIVRTIVAMEKDLGSYNQMYKQNERLEKQLISCRSFAPINISLL